MTKKNANLSKIKKVFSHVHALNQCRENLKQLKIKPVNFIDTAGAAKYISESWKRCGCYCFKTSI